MRSAAASLAAATSGSVAQRCYRHRRRPCTCKPLAGTLSSGTGNPDAAVLKEHHHTSRAWCGNQLMGGLLCLYDSKTPWVHFCSCFPKCNTSRCSV